MKKKKWWLVPLIGVLILLGIGGKLVIDKQNKAEKLQKEMIEIVKSEEAKQVVEEGLKNLDPKALTPEGVIQSYEIDYNSIEHNPMGGIMFTTYLNNDKELYIHDSLNKYRNEEFEGGGSALSPKLSELLKESTNND
ncbi:DUF1310 family protein [Enterococcus faecium]|uniref:DUF1310 family protein n=1 Tax=Enterococcus faecium TaxID=1352 RepID=UPI000F50E711|nr:DUF1310 family protein [Enterococcus faecium]EGP4822997.1 DUF1310 domain-containing protein [Enterococcus faecium]EGP5709936.1 hypothetical protein [Enterococcus faecium]EME8157284.1 DUF1310 domain-containing protein [Enterococcus faecium]EME8270980.1 DUF1310 domain-containing protein [Enterococcus faecium]ROX44457.1 DUF1310 family protein [Enterococcus faecium]